MSSDQPYTPTDEAVREIYVENAYIYEHIEGEDELAPYRAQFDRWLAAHDARVRRDAAYVAWHEGQASGWRSAQEECEMNGMVGDLYHPHTETEPCPYAPEETP